MNLRGLIMAIMATITMAVATQASAFTSYVYYQPNGGAERQDIDFKWSKKWLKGNGRYARELEKIRVNGGDWINTRGYDFAIENRRQRSFENDIKEAINVLGEIKRNHTGGGDIHKIEYDYDRVSVWYFNSKGRTDKATMYGTFENARPKGAEDHVIELLWQTLNDL